VLADCVRVVALLGREWNLSAEEEATYAHAIAASIPEPYNDAQLQRIARYYHLDYQEVQALRDAQNRGHLDAWAKWPQRVRQFLHNANLDWVTDNAIAVEDLVQIALKELYEAIASYHFGSRFSTWAYTVILRAARHAVRAQRAAKRSGTLVAIDDPETAAQLSSHGDDPTALAQNAELIKVINGILEARGGLRWVEIFQCWAHEDQRLVDIGRQVGLSTGRVSVLIEQMRSLLRQNPDLLEWYHSEIGQGDAPDADEKQLGDAPGEITA
jgi:RNA polymerase sigma factor (sigma-70 family)